MLIVEKLLIAYLTDLNIQCSARNAQCSGLANSRDQRPLEVDCWALLIAYLTDLNIQYSARNAQYSGLIFKRKKVCLADLSGGMKKIVFVFVVSVIYFF